MCYFKRVELQIDAINSSFENSESTLFMKSVSAPLMHIYNFEIFTTFSSTKLLKEKHCIWSTHIILFPTNPFTVSS